MKVLRFDDLGSTQDRAVEIARDAGDDAWTTVVADRQSKGRGRKGDAWHSPPGVNLYFSMIARPPDAFEDAPVVNHAAALAVARALSEHGLACAIKWPNDVLVGDRKICGILSRAGGDDKGGRYIVCGVGLNVNVKDFPPELSGRATSMLMETGRAFDREAVLESVLEALRERLELLFERGFASQVDDYLSIMAHVGESYVDAEGEALGEIEGIDRRGRLLVRRGAGSELVAVGRM
ncbi:MAG: biotin--[acetyl-CoA-carboxylase] ligase [Elusimicrobiota bacterium]